jgi:hypothetical protein
MKDGDVSLMSNGKSMAGEGGQGAIINLGSTWLL